METPLSARRISTRLASLGCSKPQNKSSEIGCENLSGHKRKHDSEPSDEKKRVKGSQVVVTKQQDNSLCREKSKFRRSASVEENMENEAYTASSQSCVPDINIQVATPSTQSTPSCLEHLCLNMEEDTTVKTNSLEAGNDSEIVTDHSKVVTSDLITTTHDDQMNSITVGGDPDNPESLLNPVKTMEDSSSLDGDMSKIERADVDQKHSRRRSSFVHGRKSTVFPVMSECSFDISADLPQDQRLAKLTAVVLQCSLNRVYTSLSDVEAIQQFTVQARAAGETCINCLEENGTFQMATLSQGFVPNPANNVTQERITSLLAYSNKLKREIDRWNEILEEHSSEAKIAEQKYKAVHENPIKERPSCGLTLREQKILEKQTNLTEAMSRLQSYKNRALCAVQSIMATVKTFQQFQHLVDKKLRERAEAIYTKTFPDMKEIEAKPQQLIESVLEFKD